MTVGKGFLQAFVEGWWRQYRGDVRRQAIQDSRCSHSEDLIADCFQSTSLWLDADRRRLRESSSTAHCKSLDRYSGAVPSRQRKHKNGQTERSTFWDAQPVQITQQRCNMVVFSAVGRCTPILLPRTLSTDCRRSCKRRDIPMRTAVI